MRHIRLDVHKNNIAACVLTKDEKPKFEKDSEKIGDFWILDELLEFGDKDGFCVMIESGTYAYQPYRFFSDHGVETRVIHAHSQKIITHTDKKTDKKDALAIARMLKLWKRGDIDLKMSFMPSKGQCELKDLSRYREEISKKINDETRRIKSQMTRNAQPIPGSGNLQVKKVRSELIAAYSCDATLMYRMNDLERLFAERDIICKEVESRLPDSDDVELLAGIPGIGRQTAVQIMPMIIDIDRFSDSEKLCAYFGMVPRVRDSGGKEHHGRMTKNDDRMMRGLMERATESHIRHCESDITGCYRRLEPRMGTKKALITASRKMLSAIYAVLKSKRPFGTAIGN